MADILLARKLANQLQAALADAVPIPTPSPTVVGIATPDALDRAISLAAEGATLRLDPTLVYPAPLTLPKPLWLVGIAPLGAAFAMRTMAIRGSFPAKQAR